MFYYKRDLDKSEDLSNNGPFQGVNRGAGYIHADMAAIAYWFKTQSVVESPIHSIRLHCTAAR
jgi:hypothetical protein